jgi:hypothetical protein
VQGIKGLEIMALNHDQGRRFEGGGSHENLSFMRIIHSTYKFLVGPLCFRFSAINRIITSIFCGHFFLVSAKAKHATLFSHI